MTNSDKIHEFERVTKELNKIGIIPILYGSLGLSQSISRDIETNDIDILVEDQKFKSEFDEIHKVFNSTLTLLTQL